jgi:hypothetical protein
VEPELEVIKQNPEVGMTRTAKKQQHKTLEQRFEDDVDATQISRHSFDSTETARNSAKEVEWRWH